MNGPWNGREITMKIEWKEVRGILKNYGNNLERIQRLQMRALRYQNDPYTLDAIYKEIDKLSLVIEISDKFIEIELRTKSAILLDLWCEGWTAKRMAQEFKITAEGINKNIEQSCKAIAKEVNSIESN